jgi:hypothetical protein
MSITSVANDLVTSVSVINAQKPLPPTISGYSVGGVDDTALDPAGGQTVLINGTGFLAGATITFDGSAVAVVTYVNPNQLTFTSPAKSAGTYTIYVVNADGGTAIYIPGIIYSVLPTWTTSAGTLGSYYETTSISNTVIASGDAPITYALYSGSLPTGSTLYANGVITGTAPVDSSSTTYSFTIQATDAQLQDSTRSFSLTINVDAVTWVSPANAATYTTAVDSVIANVALSATDAAGYSVSYSANALPTGLTLTGSNISGTPTVIADSSTLLTATASTTTRSAVRTINWSITVANDVYFEYNTLLIPGASTTFVDDASTNNFAVTIAGDTKPNNNNPYTPGYYSNYFDGTGDYISVPDNVAFTMAAGDFTIECWVNLSTISGSQIIIGTCDSGGSQGSMSFVLNVNSGTPRIGVGYGGTMYFATAASAITANTWVHIAGVRNGASVYIYVNGVQSTALNMASLAITDSTQIVAIGRNGAGNFEYVTGYVSNARIVKGTAVYTGAFTPPTLAPLTNAGSTSAAAYPSTINVDITFASSATSLLTSQSNRFIDNSTNAFTVTVAGNTSIKSFQPFTPNTSYSTYGSGYFDGTGDYLSTTSNAALNVGSGAFTVEAWIYPNVLTNYGQIVGQNVTSNNYWMFTIQANGVIRQQNYFNIQVSSATDTIVVGKWQHVVLVRDGSNNLSIFVNGIRVANTTDSTNWANSSVNYIGASLGDSGYFNGYISNVRVVTGSSVYDPTVATLTVPIAPLTAIANTSLLTLQNNQSVNNNVFLDNSTNNFLVTRAGNTTQGTFSPYGGNWSNYFDGTGDWLTIPNNSAFTFGAPSGNTNDFTIEFWIYQTNTSITGPVCTAYSAGTTSYWMFNTNRRGSDGANVVGYLNFYMTDSFYIETTSGFLSNVWNHVAVSRTGTTVSLFLNGTEVATTTSSVNPNATGTLQMGGEPSALGRYLTGYISNLRIVKGTALYTASFTPSTTPLTTTSQGATSSQVSLLTCADNRLVDDSINNFTITKNGDVSVQRFSPFNPSLVTPTSYSGYFDGTGDYISAPYSSGGQLGSNNFTIELWINLSSVASGQQIVSAYTGATNYNYTIFTTSSGTLNYYLSSTGTSWNISNGLSIGNISVNTWYHVALVRNGSTFTPYLNGVAGTTATSASAIYSNTIPTYIGAAYNAGASAYVTGYISNLRIVNGTAVYTSAFTPPTTPLTAIANTVLLTCQSPTFIDNSINNFTISAFGNSQPTQQNPFGYTSATTQGYTASTIGGSGYFDGSGDYLQPSATANTAMMAIANSLITIEFWVYTTTIQAVTAYVTSIFGQYLGVAINGRYMITLAGSGTISSQQVRFAWTTSPSTDTSVTSSTYLNQNSWNHVAITIDSTTPASSTITIYSNGVGQIFTGKNLSSQTVDNGSPFYIGAEYGGNYQGLSGYLSDFRFLRGQLVYKSNFVPPSAPLTAVQNTTLLTNMTSAGIYNAAMMNNMETVGDARVSTSVTKYGSGAMYFDGTGDWLSVPSSPNMAFGTGDFTVECWAYWSATASTGKGIVNLQSSGTFNFYWDGGSYSTNYFVISNRSVNQLTYSFSPTINTWYHLAVSRSGLTMRLFINGVLATSVTDSTNYGQGIASIGGDAANAWSWNGYLDDLRITKGIARYTANFTPPTAAMLGM